MYSRKIGQKVQINGTRRWGRITDQATARLSGVPMCLVFEPTLSLTWLYEDEVTPIHDDPEILAPTLPLAIPAMDAIASNEKSEEYHLTGCHGGRDGECHWKSCPQVRDGEPVATGRHCPLDATVTARDHISRPPAMDAIPSNEKSEEYHLTGESAPETYSNWKSE